MNHRHLLAAMICALTIAPAGAMSEAPVPAGLTEAALPSAALFESATQGGLVRGRLPPGSRAFLDGAPVQVSPDGAFVIGFGREAKPNWEFKVVDGEGNAVMFPVTVAQRTYDVQVIDGLPPKTVEPPPEEMARIEREWLLKRDAKRRDTAETWFLADFAWPLEGRISGVYGSQRIRNGKPGRPHYGLDIAAPEGTPIASPAPGRVTLAESDMFFEGGLVFIDHGHGLMSNMMHLSRVDVRVGQEIKPGDIIGAVGMTGRSTGPHLHWGMTWLDAQIDPHLLLPPKPAPSGAETASPAAAAQ